MKTEKDYKKEIRKEYQRTFYLKHPEKRKEYKKRYFLKHPEKRKEYLENAKLRYYEKKDEIKEKQKIYQSKIFADKTIYLIFDENGTLLFKLPRWKIIRNLGIANGKIDFALASGESVNGFLIDIFC